MKQKTTKNKIKNKEEDNRNHQKHGIKPRIIVYILIIISVVSLISILTFGSLKEKDIPIISADELAEQASIRATIRDLYQPVRGEYGMGQILARVLDQTCYNELLRDGKPEDVARKDCTKRDIREFEIKDVMTKLPSIPEDFYYYKYMMMSGQISQEELANLSSDYYMQPEWISHSFTESCIPLFLREADTTRWTPEGYGTFPHELIIGTTKGGVIEVYAFVHAGCGVENYQGLKLVPSFSKSSMGMDGIVIPIDQELSKQHIGISITPDNILLSPAYPLYQNGWVQKVKVTIRIGEDTPSGIYGAGFDVTTADPYYEAMWRKDLGGGYTSKSSFGIAEQQFKVTIYVQ